MTFGWVLVGLAGAWLGFAYVGYPAILWVLARLSPREVKRAEIAPPLSVVIAVHNGAQEIRAKLENTLAQDYPGSLQVIVASDGSSDGTDDVAREFADRGVELVRNETRGGKEAAQAVALGRAEGEIVVFTDVGAELEPEALRRIVAPFADPAVGCVSSEDAVDSGEGEGAYVRYEMWLRRLESSAASLVGVSGSFFAVRRDLCEPWPTHLAEDFRSALEAIRRGYRAVSEPGARARFKATPDPADEWRRKVRTVRRGLAVLSGYTDLLLPRYRRAAFCLWGHKVARFTSPFALAGLLLGAAVLSVDSGLGVLLLVAQLVFYAIGALGLWAPRFKEVRLARLAGFFLLVNASMLVSWVHHFSGNQVVTWEPTRR